MASDTVKKHPYHMVPPSPWPMVGTIAALMLAFGLVWYMKEGSSILLLSGFAVLLWMFYRWWRDVVSEARSADDHNEVVRGGLRMGMVMFIASEVMFFFAFFLLILSLLTFLSKVGPQSSISLVLPVFLYAESKSG